MRFGARLREADVGLEATLRVRRRVVSELAADLEDLYAAYRAEGHPAAEARRLAERVLAPSAEALAALSAVHRPIWLRLADRFGVAGSHRVEWSLLLALTAAFCGSAVVALLRAGLVLAPAPFPLLVLALGFVTLSYALGRGASLFLAVDRTRRAQGVDTALLAMAAVAVLAIAGLGVLVGLSRTASAIAADPARQAELLLRWIREGAGLASLGLLVALADGLALLVLRRRAGVLAVDVVAGWSGPALDPGSGSKRTHSHEGGMS